MPEQLPAADVLATLVITTKLVALATLPIEAPAPEVPVKNAARLATEPPFKRPVGTGVPNVVVCPGPTPISGVNPKSTAPVPVSVIVTEVTTALAGRITAEFEVVEAVMLAVAAQLATKNGKLICIEPAEAVRVESPPVERHTLEVVAFVMTNCPSYKVQPINRVCVCWGSLIGGSPRLYRSYYVFSIVQHLLRKIV